MLAISTPIPENWLEAFAQLEELLSQNNGQKKVVFLDELPRLDTAQSGFLPALDYFWNSFASARNDIILIVCGSAASWMINTLIHNKGGLHNNTGLDNAGSTTRILNELEESGFIRRYTSFGKKVKHSLYQLSDFYSLFYIKFIRGSHALNENEWINGLNTPQQRTWSGYAFEQVCFAHL